MQRTIEVIRVRFPTGRVEEFIGRDFKTQNALKKAYQTGAITEAVYTYLCKCTDADFYNIASSRELIKENIL